MSYIFPDDFTNGEKLFVYLVSLGLVILVFYGGRLLIRHYMKNDKKD